MPRELFGGPTDVVLRQIVGECVGGRQLSWEVIHGA
jgi:hypothetical protein